MTRDLLPALPLRLAAEPYAQQSISSSCVALGVHNTTASASLEVAVLVDDLGIRAFCTSNSVSRRVLLEAVGLSDSPEFLTEKLPCLVRAGGNQFEWHVYNESAEFPLKPDANTLSKHDTTAIHNSMVAKLLTDSIRFYYAQQILEPSVRGFLSVLEKQFARSDLYLFELLQNAVDDGAAVVKFAYSKNGLTMTHNGRNFTPLDVLGLSSVGLSTKGRENKRTIGFMGVGFKAVYKRYERVTIRDGTYSFRYEKPASHKEGYGWVMQPMWINDDEKQQDTDSGDTRNWCRFQLEKPVGGVRAIQKDLAVLPLTAPPLLGRAALEKRKRSNDDACWTLDWNGKIHTVCETELIAFPGTQDSTQVVTVTITDRAGNNTNHRWLFVSHRYTPSRQAAQSYRSHTKRSHVGEEELCGFVCLGGEDGKTPLVRSRSGSIVKGIVHSVLPTKLRMPIPMNVQGSWLLSVDRQEVQDLGDNEWNKDLVRHLAMLVANFFRWAAHQELSTAAHYTAIGQLLPAPAMPLSSTRSCAEFLGQSVSLEGLERVLFSERVLPVAVPCKTKEESKDSSEMDVDTLSPDATRIATGYYEGKYSIWVPPSWLRFLGAELLRGWLGRRPLRSDLLGEAAYHPIFASKRVIGQLDPLPSRTAQLARVMGVGSRKRVDSSSIGMIMRLMAAVGAAYDEYPEETTRPETTCTIAPSKKRAAVGSGGATDDTSTKATNPTISPPPALPTSISVWPFFLTQDMELLTLEEVVLPASEFASVPEELRFLLRPFCLPDNRRTGREAFKNSRKRGRASAQAPSRIQEKKLLHPMLEAAIYKVDSGESMSEDPNEEDVMTCAALFLSRARAEVPSNTVSVPAAASNLFASYSKLRNCQEEQISAVLRITEFALSTDNPSLLSHVLVDCCSANAQASALVASNPGSVLVVAAREAYTGKALDEDGPGADLENFAGGSLRFLSTRYTGIAESSSEKRKLLRLFDQAGVQGGLSANITAMVNLEKGDRHLHTNDVLPSLADNKLPTTRKNAPKNIISLPYGLLVPMDRRKYSLIDAEIPKEWERIVGEMSPEAAVGFVSLLLAIPLDDATIVTAKTTPAATKCLAGQAEVDPHDEKSIGSDGSGRYKKVRAANDTLVPLRRRLYYLPPGQPGAKAIDVSRAKIVEQLSRWKWLPCRMPSQSDVTSALTLLRPEEALLSPDSSRPEMPVVDLRPVLLKRLASSAIANALVWGTRAPPPPVDRLAELAQEADKLVSSASRTENEMDVNSVARIARIAGELVSTWTAIARAHLRGNGLSAANKEKLRNILHERGDSCPHCVPVRWALDARSSNTNWIVPVSRCVLIPDQSTTDNEHEKLKRLTVKSFVESGYMCDFNHIGSNPFFSQPDISAAVIQLANIQTLENLPTRTIITTSGEFVRYCCATEPAIVSPSSPLRSSFSFAMRWCIGSPDQLDIRQLKLWVRMGPGVGSKALPARWVSLRNGPVHVVLDDDKSRTRSSLLTPDMGLQLLGVLNHFEKEKDCPNVEVLAAIDRDVVKFCGVLRLSDKRFRLTTKASGKPEAVDGASSKFQLVCALLKAMDVEREASNAKDLLDLSSEPPPFLRHESLTREFTAPGMTSPAVTQLYAIWGRAPKHLMSRRGILVCGAPEDYSVELEQLALNHIGARSGPSISTVKAYRAALRLLSHLESDASFEKFLLRDFPDSEVTLRWRSLMKRSQILGNLKKAEEIRDAKALRSALVEAEEACEDDVDEGDAVLRSARELLPRLEEEVRAREEAERKKQKEEREKAARREEALREEKEAFEKWKQEEKEKALSKLAGNGDVRIENAVAEAAPLGRGRGLTLPAWVTAGPGPSKSETDDTSKRQSEGVENNTPHDDLSSSMENAKSIVSSIVGEGLDAAAIPAPEPTLGRGRGVSDLPSWMASGSSEATSDALATIVQNGAGRGRGVSNLPAWMTSATLPSKGEPRAVSESENFAVAEENVSKHQAVASLEDSGSEERPRKKARLLAEPFEFSLRVLMEASDLPKFITWLRPKVEEGARQLDGTAVLQRKDSDALLTTKTRGDLKDG